MTSKLNILAFAAAAMLLLSSCDNMVTLFSGLEESQANTVMAALRSDGMTCQKVSGEEGTWNVTIEDSQFAQAALLCEHKGLPHRQFHGVGAVFKKSGMVSSPSEERIRFIEAISQDLAHTLTMLDGVIDARVHVVMPQNDPFSKNTIPSSASVVIRAAWNADLSPEVPQIKSVVKNAIEGLAYEKITVTIFQDEAAPAKDAAVVSAAADK